MIRFMLSTHTHTKSEYTFYFLHCGCTIALTFLETKYKNHVPKVNTNDDMAPPGVCLSGAEEPSAEEGGGVSVGGAAPPAGVPPDSRALLSHDALLH